jgi:hypothetical protein
MADPGSGLAATFTVVSAPFLSGLVPLLQLLNNKPAPAAMKTLNRNI